MLLSSCQHDVPPAQLHLRAPAGIHSARWWSGKGWQTLPQPLCQAATRLRCTRDSFAHAPLRHCVAGSCTRARSNATCKHAEVQKCTSVHLYTFTHLHFYTFTLLYFFASLHLHTFTLLHVCTFTLVHFYTSTMLRTAALLSAPLGSVRYTPLPGGAPKDRRT
jgi:hypothetical protein